MKPQRKDAEGKKTQQHPNHPSSSLCMSKVRHGLCIKNQTTATNPKISMCEESAIIIIIIITYPLTVKSLGTTDDFTTSFLHFSLSSTALWDLANSRPVHSLRLSSHLFFCLPCLFPPFTVPCKMVLTRCDEQKTSGGLPVV